MNRKSGKKKWLLLAGVAGVGAFAYKKLGGGDEPADWQPSDAQSQEETELRALQADHLVEGLDGDL